MGRIDRMKECGESCRKIGEEWPTDFRRLTQISEVSCGSILNLCNL